MLLYLCYELLCIATDQLDKPRTVTMDSSRRVGLCVYCVSHVDASCSACVCQVLRPSLLESTPVYTCYTTGILRTPSTPYCLLCAMCLARYIA